jgi:hypothetical protein
MICSLPVQICLALLVLEAPRMALCVLLDMLLAVRTRHSNLRRPAGQGSVADAPEGGVVARIAADWPCSPRIACVLHTVALVS